MKITAIILLIVITISMLLSNNENWQYKWSIEKILEVANKAPNIIDELKILLVTKKTIKIPETSIQFIDVLIQLINGIKDVIIDILYVFGLIGQALIVIIYYIGEVLEIT